MDPVDDDLQNPDESRPTKRARLDAPLSITEDTFADMAEEDDWDDVYGDGSEAPKPASAEIASAFTEPSATIDAPPNDRAPNEGLDGVPAEAISQGDALVPPPTSTQDLDQPSAKMLEEVTEVVQEPTTQAHENSGFLGEGKPLDPVPQASTSSESISVEQKTNMIKDGETQVTGETQNENADKGEETGEHAGQEATASIQTQDNPNGEAMELDDTAPTRQKATEDPEFMAAAAAQKDNAQAEWQFNPSDEESSDTDSSDSDSTSDDSDSDSEGGYEMLDAATAARILMSGDGDDDDGDRGKGKPHTENQPRTANEKQEEVVPKPDITLTPEMKITLLGTVESAVNNLILIKGATPGEYQVLESGSVLCSESRQVIGAVADTFGRVQEPLYSVAFTNAQEIKDCGIEIGTQLYYVNDHSTFVFTQPLRNVKGTDASNIHDEEVGEDEIEFSDDEAEAEYKRQKKLAKKAGRGGLSRSAFTDGPRNLAPGTNDAPAQTYGSGMSYDDDAPTEGGGEEFYRPLKRPDNLSQLMAGGPPSSPQQRPAFDRGRGRGRGDRGRGRGDRGRGDRGRGRGGRGGHDHHHHRPTPDQAQQNRLQNHRGSSHSFPDQHNYSANEPKQPHALPPRPANFTSAPVDSSHAQPPQQQQQIPPNFQFGANPYTYGNMASQQQQPHFQPTVPPPPMAYPQIPQGAFINPAFYPYQAQQQHHQAPQQAAHAFPSAPAPQQYQPSYPQNYPAAFPQHQQHQQHQQQNQQQQIPDLADIMRRLGNSAGP